MKATGEAEVQRQKLFTIRPLEARDDETMFCIARARLKENGLDVSGSVYFDPALRNLSDYYCAAAACDDPSLCAPRRGYFVAVDERDLVVAGAGFAEYGDASNTDTAELQKLYASTSAEGFGISYSLIERVESAALKAGYTKLYLETEHRLHAAIHVYENLGFTRLDRPPVAAQHSAMDRFYIEDLPRVAES
jgi:putative acetyltransferase